MDLQSHFCSANYTTFTKNRSNFDETGAAPRQQKSEEEAPIVKLKIIKPSQKSCHLLTFSI